MRVGSSLLLFNGLCYQSYGWDLLRPLGGLQTALNSLEEYGCDEIAIIRPARDNDESLATDLKLIGEIQSMTPISFGGGVRTQSQLESLSSLPFERLVLSSAFIHSSQDVVSTSVAHYGRQAIQCLLPFKHEGGECLIFDSSSNRYVDIKDIDLQFIDEYANEVILHDTVNEGYEGKFDFDVLYFIPLDLSKIVVSGGIGRASCRKAKKLGVASALVENRLLHREYSVERYRDAI